MNYESNIKMIMRLERELAELYSAHSERKLTRALIDALMFLARANEQNALDEVIRTARTDLLNSAAFADPEMRRANG